MCPDSDVGLGSFRQKIDGPPRIVSFVSFIGGLVDSIGSRVVVGMLEVPQASCLFAKVGVSTELMLWLPRPRASAQRGQGVGRTYDLALIFLRLRLSRRTLFFLHLALILNDAEDIC